MNLTLSAKRTFSGGDARRVWEGIEDHVTLEECERAVSTAVDETLLMVRSFADGDPDRCVYGWSGGKDSIALQVVMERAGVDRSVLGVIPHLEFHSYLHWVEHHRPAGLRIVPNRRLTLSWLSEPAHQRFLFPTNGKDGYFWTLQSARHAQYAYQRVSRPRLQIFGRRTQDGNVCGDHHGVLRTKQLIAYCPLRDWPHELVLATIHYYRRALPPTYEHDSVWLTGTGCWPGRRVGDRDACWNDTYEVEADRVHEAAAYAVPGARDCLARNKR